MSQALLELRGDGDPGGAPAPDGGPARPGRRPARPDPIHTGCCVRPTTRRSPTCGRWARTSTRSRRIGGPPCRIQRAGGARSEAPAPPAEPEARGRAGGAAPAGRSRQRRRFGVRFRRGSRGSLPGRRDPADRRRADGGPPRSRRRGGSPEARRPRRPPAGSRADPRAPRKKAAAAATAPAEPEGDEARNPGPSEAIEREPRRRRSERSPDGQPRCPSPFSSGPPDVVAGELLGTLVVSTLGGAPDQRPDRRDRGLPRPGRPGLPRVPRPPPRAERVALRPAGQLVRLPVVRHALVRQPGLRSAGPRQRRAPQGAGAGRRGSRPCAAAGRRGRPPAVLRTRAALSGARDHAEPRRQPDAPVGREGRTRGAAAEIVASPRIGITKAADWPLRFVVAARPGPRARHGNEPCTRKAKRAADDPLPVPVPCPPAPLSSPRSGASPSRCRGRNGGRR